MRTSNIKHLPFNIREGRKASKRLEEGTGGGNTCWSMVEGWRKSFCKAGGR